MWSGAFVYTPDDEADAFPLLMDDEVDAMDLGDLNHPYDAIMPDLPFPEQVRRRPSRPGTPGRTDRGISGRLTASVRPSHGSATSSPGTARTATSARSRRRAEWSPVVGIGGGRTSARARGAAAIVDPDLTPFRASAPPAAAEVPPGALRIRRHARLVRA